MTDITHHELSINGVQMHVAVQGKGPLVVLCHGWPELWRTLRHQMAALAEAGFRAVAPDMRGCGRTEAPANVDAYTICHLVGDVVALVGALGERQAIIVGHDWGSTVAWNAAMMRPDVFRAVVGMSVPARRRGPAPPLEMLKSAGLSNFYWCYFQEPGVAEAELERDVEDTFRRLLYCGSGDAPPGQAGLLVPSGKGFLDEMALPKELPAWLAPEDLSFISDEYRRTGFRGGLNWYRNIDRNWALTAPFDGATIRQPALFIGGARDLVIAGPTGAAALAELERVVPGLRRKELIDGAGHWIGEERPREVNAALVRFLKEL